MTYLAVCDGKPEPGWAIGIGLGAVLIYVLPIGWSFVTARAGSRLRLLLVLLGSIGIGFLFGWVIPGGFDGDANYLALFFAGTAVGAALGAVVAAVWGRAQPIRHVVLGALGGSAFLAFAIGLLIFALTATGACLD
jgi:hypothetical protein